MCRYVYVGILYVDHYVFMNTDKCTCDVIIRIGHFIYLFRVIFICDTIKNNCISIISNIIMIIIIIVFFWGFNAATQLALELQQERAQVVCSNRVARKRPARRHSRNRLWT